MFSVAQYREIISGRRQDWRAGLLRRAFSLAEPVVRYAVDRRNRRYDRGFADIQRVPATVVSVGNITTGGTGKTPLVAWIAQWFQKHQRRVVMISRGYGSKRGEPNDEALELAALLPDVPHLQNANRVQAARRALDEFHAEVLLLDDAFQHRRLHRDLNIVLIDALEPFGFDHLLPRGLLREPLSSLGRADAIAVSRADLVAREQLDAITARIRAHAPDSLLMEIAHRPCALLNAMQESFDARTLSGQRVAAFCGIGNPQGFRETLIGCGSKIIDFRVYSDHFRYGPNELGALSEWADRLDVDQVVCTMKDFVKLRVPSLGRRPLRALTIGIDFITRRAEFESRLEKLVECAPPRA